jgi:gliding motility-associated-like protein
MAKKLLILFFFLASLAKAQCPQVYDYLGNLSNNPYWISCTGNNYIINFQSNANFGPYTIVWGDGSSNYNAASYSANSIITHTYSSTVDTFLVQLIIPSLSCTLTGVVVMEKPVNASIQIPIGGVTQACAPATLQFINSSTDVSQTTQFLWNFGDGSPPVPYTYTNAGMTISHTYSAGTVNCQTQVTLQAMNYCSFGNPTIANFNPIQIYDIDNAAITPDAVIKCWPDNVFTFTNTTNRNCVPQGNTFQRQEWWNFGNYWGLGYDSIINWKPWPPTTPVTIAYPSVGTYTVMLRDSNLCGIAVAVTSVSIVNPPTASLVAPTGTLCQNAPFTFTNITTGTGYTYQWNFGDGGGFATLAGLTQTHTYATAGTYTVKLVASIPGAGNGCRDTAQVVVSILPAPTANFTYSPAFGCTALSGVSFTNTSVGAVGWNWNFGNGITATTQTVPAQNYTVIGTHVITLVVTGSNTCVNTKTASVTVYQPPTANFSPVSTCVGSMTSFTNLSTAAATNTITTQSWNFGDGSAATTVFNPSHTYTVANTYTVQLVVNTAFCTDTVKLNVVANVKPTANFSMTPVNGCPTLTVNFNNTSLNASNFLWNFGTVPTSTSTAVNPVFNYTNTSAANIIYTVTLLAGTGAGCSDTLQKTIAVFPKPIASFTPNVSMACSPMLVTFSNTSTGATTYSWNLGNSVTSGAANPSTTYTNTSLFAQTFSIQLVAVNANGCMDTAITTIITNPKPLATFTMIPASGCSPLPVNFPPVLGITSYSWNFGDGNGSNALNPTHTYTNTTSSTIIYTVSLIASNAFGCIDTSYGMPLVYPRPTAGFTMNPNSGCSPMLVNFTNNSSLNFQNNWTLGNGNMSSLPNPATTYTTANTSANTSFPVKLVVTSVNGCKDSAQNSVTLYPKPDATFGVDTPACSPKILNFSNLSQGATTYAWNFGNGNSSNAINPTQQYINSSLLNITYTVSLIATNANNCTDTVKVPLIIHSQPNFNIIATPDSGCTDLTVNFPSIPGAVNYSWSFGDGNGASAGNISHTFVNTTNSTKNFTVQLIATDKYNCADTNTKMIRVFPKPTALFQANPTTVFIPNMPVNCLNLSNGNTGGNMWTFGDGGTSTDVNPSHTYTQEGEYQIILIVTNDKGCKDTFSLPNKIIAIGESSFDIPNAFTPNPAGGSGGAYDPNATNNDVFHPVIKGVEKYQMSIYSRWGELLFETKDVNVGWDGYYKGKMCTQDVYVWKVSATTVEGNVIKKTGDVLLLK